MITKRKKAGLKLTPDLKTCGQKLDIKALYEALNGPAMLPTYAPIVIQKRIGLGHPISVEQIDKERQDTANLLNAVASEIFRIGSHFK